MQPDIPTPPMSPVPPVAPINPIGLPPRPIKKRSPIIPAVIILVILALLGVLIWALVSKSSAEKSYNDLKSNFDSQLKTASDKATSDIQAQLTAEAAKNPPATFTGPANYGTLSFQFPKNWSVYSYKDGTVNGDDYEAYFYPSVVPPVGIKQPFALRVYIEETTIDKKLQTFQSYLNNHSLKETDTTVNGVAAKRFDGKISSYLTGSFVLFTIRDKVVTIETDSDPNNNSYSVNDFNTILSTVTFKS